VDRAANRRRGLTRAGAAAAGGTLAITAVLAMVRLGLAGPIRPDTVDDLLPVLLGAALLCVVGLARRTHPTTAWLATIGAAAVVTADLASYAREARPVVDDQGWRALGVAVSVAALLAIGAATAYLVTRPRLRRRWLTTEGVAIMLIVAVAASWAVANPSDTALAAGSPLGSLGLVTRSFLVLTSMFTLVGSLGDLWPAAERARHRAMLTQRGSAARVGIVWAWLVALADELSPGRRRARSAVLAERTRVARDIHADVVPGLRQLLTDAERGVAPDRLAESLRDVLADVEAVGAARHPIQLEIGGLVAALEWLSERVERRSGRSVTLTVEEPSEPFAEAPPDVAESAFRVADLALDNVVRHAPGSRAVLTVRSDARAVEVSICDDGPGIADEAVKVARGRGRRGLLDMAAEAAACGARVDVGPGPGGAGTCVTFVWRSQAP
jgi:signal transduction histidine kinase